jgi:hypothetical protein
VQPFATHLFSTAPHSHTATPGQSRLVTHASCTHLVTVPSTMQRPLVQSAFLVHVSWMIDDESTGSGLARDAAHSTGCAR